MTPTSSVDPTASQPSTFVLTKVAPSYPSFVVYEAYKQKTEQFIRTTATSTFLTPLTFHNYEHQKYEFYINDINQFIYALQRACVDSPTIYTEAPRIVIFPTILSDHIPSGDNISHCILGIDDACHHWLDARIFLNPFHIGNDFLLIRVDLPTREFIVYDSSLRSCTVARCKIIHPLHCNVVLGLH